MKFFLKIFRKYFRDPTFCWSFELIELFINKSKFMKADNNLSNEVHYELDNGTRAKMSLKKQGAMNPNYGKSRDPETARKISDSLKKHHERKQAFEQAEKIAVIRREWSRYKFDNSHCFGLLRCNDNTAIYQTIISNCNAESYRVYYYDDTLLFKDFIDADQSEAFYLSISPDYDFLVNETQHKTVVLGFKPPS